MFIGVGLDGDGLRAALDDCLLTEAELAAVGGDSLAGVTAATNRLRLPDPFPAWDLADFHDHQHGVSA